MENFANYQQPMENFIQHSKNKKKQIVIDDKFSYYDYVCIKLCKSKSSKRIKSYKNFLLLESSFKEKMNIVSYFKLFYHFAILSKAPILAEYLNDPGNSKLNISEGNSSQKKIMPDSGIKLQNYLPQLRNTKT